MSIAPQVVRRECKGVWRAFCFAISYGLYPLFQIVQMYMYLQKCKDKLSFKAVVSHSLRKSFYAF